jgi:hypothetical protein
VNPANMEPYVAPYVQVRHAIHLLYATSPRSRDGMEDGPQDSLLRHHNYRFDKHGNRLPLELHGCGCSLCARSERRRLQYWEAR